MLLKSFSPNGIEAGSKKRQLSATPEWAADENSGDDRSSSTTSFPHVRDMQERLAGHFDGRIELLNKARFAREMGSPFVGAILEAGHRQLDKAPRTAKIIREWPGDPAAAALAMRFNAALHLLARRGTPRSLEALYQRRHFDFDGAVGEALATEDLFIAEALRYPTQTNEVGRAASIMAALMVAQAEHDLPFELLELGSSCGLNLNMAHYAYDLGGMTAGVLESPVKIAPEWRGQPLTVRPVDIRAARGIDLHPLDPRDPATVERLISYIWADQGARTQRLEMAFALAQNRLPTVDRGSALPWLAKQLNAPQSEGVCRVVFHSMVLQYFSVEDRRSVTDLIATAGAGASAERPMARISFEWSAARDEVRLLLTSWPSGETRHLATCHAYGAWIDWHGESRIA
jgi:hypothetical protein